ncbi:MAG: hypothetical protein JRI97_01400 [Deltaproteobacteria bacterium]|nr:hypothetical protein [Deltaproteobacteria bacterium]
MKNKDQQKSRRPYEKPRLTAIELAADEVLAVGCKVASGVRGFDNAGPSCAMPRRCYGPGS